MSDPISDDAFARFAQQHVLATASQVEAARIFQNECVRRGTPVSLPDALVKIGAITLAQRDIAEQRLQAQQKGGIQQLLHYRLLRKLGEGGMGAVYLAEDTLNDRQVALKVLPRQHTDSVEFMKRFRREADAMGRLRHGNVVAAFSMGEDQGRHFIVMEYCEGETLDKLLHRDTYLPADEATRIVLQAARGLQYAHGQGIVHRDIKPSNIIVTPAGIAKVLDLGLSKDLEHEASSFVTQSGVTVGTPHYMAPEQARGDRDLDGRADIYSLGATYYHLLTGDTPFHGSTAFEVANKQIHEQLPDPRDLREEIPDGVVHIVRRMMAKRRTDRFRDCGHLVTDLDRVLEGMDPQSEVIEPVLSSVALPKVVRTPRRHFAPRSPARGPGAVPVSPPPAARVLAVMEGDGGGGGRIADLADRGFDALLALVRRGGRRAMVGAVRGVRALRVATGTAARVTTRATGTAARATAHATGTAARATARATSVVARRLKAIPPRTAALVYGVLASSVILLLVMVWMAHREPVSRPAVMPAPVSAAPAGEVVNEIAESSVASPPEPEPRPAPLQAVTMALPAAEIHGQPNTPRSEPAAIEIPTGTQSPAAATAPPEALEGWLDSVKALPPDEQVRRVIDRLKALNVGFDGRHQHRIESSRVTEFDLSKAHLRDLAPLRALPGLQILDLSKTRVDDLSALRNLPLREIRLAESPVVDLSPLRGKSLTLLDCCGTFVSDLSPLEGMPLTYLDCRFTNVGNLSPLRGAPLIVLEVEGTLVRDLSPVQGAPLKKVSFRCDPGAGPNPLRGIRSLETVNGLAAADFWRTSDEAALIARSGESLEPDPAWADAFELLPLVDPEVDAVSGTWKRVGEELVCDRARGARLEIPFRPPEEFDVRVRFCRQEGNAGVVHVLSCAGKSFAWLMGASSNTVFGFSRVGGKEAGENPASVRMAWCLENLRPYTSLLQVRKSGVKAFLNGRELVQWKPGDGELSPSPVWALRDTGRLGLGCDGGVLAIRCVDVLDVTGHGQVLRPRPAVMGDGDGLKGAYYVGKTLGGAPVFTRVDACVDFAWDVFAPDSRLPEDSFSIRWTGQVLAPHSELFTFYAIADDAARLWVDGKLLIDDWRTTNRAIEKSGTIRLKAGTRYDLKLEYFESRSDATVRLLWSSPSTPKAVIPKRHLYPSP